MLLSTKIIDFATGRDFDITEDATIEITMGGISLLNLGQRTHTHTQAFTLPRTPNNEELLLYAGIPHFYANPRKEVILQKGLIMLRGFIQVLSSDQDKFEVNFDFDDGGGFQAIKDFNFYKTVFTDSNFPEYDNNGLGSSALLKEITNHTDRSVMERDYYAPHVAGGIITSVSDTSGIFTGGLVTRARRMIARIAVLLGIQINNIDLIPANLYILNKWVGFAVKPIAGGTKIQPYVSQFNGYNGEFLSFATVIKAICQLCFLDFNQQNYNTFSFTSVPSILTGTNIVDIDTPFLSFKKTMKLPYASKNFVRYKDGDGRLDSLFYSNGTGSKTAVAMEATQVYFDYNRSSTALQGVVLDKAKDVVLLSYDTSALPVTKDVQITSRIGGNSFFEWEDIQVRPLYTRSVSSFGNYNALYTYFTNPIIFDVECFLTPSQYTDILATRLIRNVSLSGKFFVEEMAYNVTTSKAVLKLIKGV